MIDKNTKIGELLEMAPEKADILLEAGMHCLGCPASQAETLEEACSVHGIDVEELVKELNKESKKGVVKNLATSFLFLTKKICKVEKMAY